jgi:hypothetical protein
VRAGDVDAHIPGTAVDDRVKCGRRHSATVDCVYEQCDSPSLVDATSYPPLPGCHEWEAPRSKGKVRANRQAAPMGDAVYATLMVGANATLGSRVLARHNQNMLNRTVCFQRRLRELRSRHPLVVVHNFDDDDNLLNSAFDRTHRIAGSLPGAWSNHLYKLFMWEIAASRVVYIDSDVRRACSRPVDPPAGALSQSADYYLLTAVCAAVCAAVLAAVCAAVCCLLASIGSRLALWPFAT